MFRSQVIYVIASCVASEHSGAFFLGGSWIKNPLQCRRPGLDPVVKISDENDAHLHSGLKTPWTEDLAVLWSMGLKESNMISCIFLLGKYVLVILERLQISENSVSYVGGSSSAHKSISWLISCGCCCLILALLIAVVVSHADFVCWPCHVI